LLQRGDGQLLTRAGQIVAGDEVTARFADGERKLQSL
jgi:hypothetical protein